MVRILTLVVLIMAIVNAQSMEEKVLYSSDAFTLTSHKVVQGSYRAEIKENNTLYSNFLESFEKGYEQFNPDVKPSATMPGFFEREVKEVQGLPTFTSSFPLLDALYKLSIEEMLLNIREDKALMAGAKWTGVWTRDISYSILLSLAIVDPDACKTSLRAKVANGRIIQDTGTGGSWPISTDRMIWAVAAYQVYLTTNDKQWLKEIAPIIRQSIVEDEHNCYDEVNIVRGESSFLDWREQTYPTWMEPGDIYLSRNLGTALVHLETYKILAEISEILGEDGSRYSQKQNDIAKAINTHLWMEDKGYYGQFLYGSPFLSLSPRSETLGEALSVLFGVAGELAGKVIESAPTTEYGTPVVFPYEEKIPPYHNNSIWPFVEAYRMWAAKQTRNEVATMHSIASILRGAALFLTNKENLVATTGSAKGTEINSDRQLWSVAGNLAIVYRVLFGIEYSSKGFSLTPFIPEPLSGSFKLSGLKYGEAEYTISVSGVGSEIVSIKHNGKEIDKALFTDLKPGKHTIEILLKDSEKSKGTQNIVKHQFAPETPQVTLSGAILNWNPIKSAVGYRVFRNGEEGVTVTQNTFEVPQSSNTSYYQIVAVDELGNESFASKPISHGNNTFEYSIDKLTDNTLSEIELQSIVGEKHIINVATNEAGLYAVEFLYANGNGPINTDNKCAIRSLYVISNYSGALVLPQRGTDNWKEKGYTPTMLIKLPKGKSVFEIRYEELNRNMNRDVNHAKIYGIRLTRLNG